MIDKKKKNVILVVGPTAIGKTSFAIKLAQNLNTKIVSCDSRQCFKELNIGVARPTNVELNLVEHFFIASHSIHENVNAGVFEKYALEKVEEIFKENDFAVMVGGTGLYASAFCNGIDEMPEIEVEIRNKIIQEYNNQGLIWLQNEVQAKDPFFWQTAEQQNPQRLMRALEIVIQTGKSIVDFKTQHKKERDFNIVKLGLELPREILTERINLRVDAMIKEGLENEVFELIKHQHLNALQTVGYKEMFEYFNNQVSLAQAIELIKTHTRQYAKRQMTWFKKDTEIKWLNPFENFDVDTIIS